MIRVDINTLVADRTPIPDNLIGLDDDTLKNLQSILDPIPDNVLGYAWWDEIDDTPSFDERTHTKGAETLTPDDQTKRVSSVCALDDVPLDDVTALAEKEVMNKMNEILAQPIDIGGGFISNLRELQANRDLFDDGGPGSINFKHGHKSLTGPEKATIKAMIRTRPQAVHNRADDILTLIGVELTGSAKVAVLDSEIDLGWPT